MPSLPSWFRRSISALALMGICTPIWALDSVEFTVNGGTKTLKSELRAVSLLAGLKGGADTPQDILSKAKAEYGALLNAAYAQGFYGPVIHVLLDGHEAASIAPLDVPAQIARIAVTVDAGGAFAFSKTKIAPLPDYAIKTDGFAVGALAASGVIVQAAADGVASWRERGFALAHVAQQSLIADHGPRTVAADITVETGPKLRFGDLSVLGAQSMRPERVQAIAGLPKGQIFSPRELERVNTRLRRTGAFRSVTLSEADRITAPDMLGITANLIEEKVRRIRFSADIATQDGISLGTSWTHRNLLGGAERLTLSGEIVNIGLDTGGLDYNLGATFDRPATFSPDTTLSLGTNFTREKQDASRSTAWNTTGGLIHYFSDTLTGNAGIASHISRVIDPSGATIFRTLSFPLGLSWDTRDIKKNAAQGVFITAGAKPFLGFGVTDNGTRLVLDARGYKAFGADDAVVIAARIQAGAIMGASLAGTPRDDLFLSGGPATVRGQPYKSLGVSVLTDSSGTAFQTGGTRYLGGTLEGRFKVGRNLGLVGFVDMGQIATAGYSSNAANWHAGAGVGLRYLTAIGPIRLDLAGPVGGNTGQGLQLYVGIGQAF